MRNLVFCSAILMAFTLGSCQQEASPSQYVFVKPYCTTVMVGGVVGITEKCFNVGDTVVGIRSHNDAITIRIAEHSSRNDGPPSNTSYQELLAVPSDHLELIDN